MRNVLTTAGRGGLAATLLAGATLTVPASTFAAPHATLPSAHARTNSSSRVDMATTDPRFGVDEAYLQANQANALGARWSRIPFIWDYIQPGGPSSWNSFALSSHGTDSIVNGELARNRDVVGLLLGTPAWAHAQNGHASWGEASVPDNVYLPYTSPKNYWAQFCYRMAKHFAGRIDDWVIWNEVSIPLGANGGSGLWTQWRADKGKEVAEYARVLEVAYQAIHAANPNAKIVMYGDPFWYDHGRFITQLYTKLAADDSTGRYHGYFDVANLHLYSNPTDFYWIITSVRSLLRQHGWGSKQIWVSETNAEPYDDVTAPARHTNFRVSMQSQAAFLVDAFASYIAAGADRIEIYRMFDGKETKKGLPAWGLINNNGQLRPVGTTFHFLIDLFKGANGGTYTAGKLFNGKGGVFKVVCFKPGARITVLWNQAGPSARYTLAAHASTATVYDKFGNSRHVKAVHGTYSFTLAGGKDFTNPYDNRVPTVGGDPVILVERST